MGRSRKRSFQKLSNREQQRFSKRELLLDPQYHGKVKQTRLREQEDMEAELEIREYTNGKEPF